jgi:hypothetical protein
LKLELIRIRGFFVASVCFIRLRKGHNQKVEFHVVIIVGVNNRLYSFSKINYKNKIYIGLEHLLNRNLNKKERKKA